VTAAGRISLLSSIALISLAHPGVASAEETAPWELLGEPAPSRARTVSSGEAEDVGARKAAEQVEPELDVNVGGAIRFNVFFKSWDAPDTVLAGGDDAAFDTFRLNVESTYGNLRLSGEYRFYAGFHMLHHAYLGYLPLDTVNVQLGVLRVPFGILPYASHNFFFGMNYYVGLEDDYDLGIRFDFDADPVFIQIAFFRNDEGSYSGGTVDSARYSYDLVRTDPSELGVQSERRTEEKNQVNVRAVYKTSHDLGTTEIGLSGQMGGLENADTQRFGIHWAAAIHAVGQYGPLNVQLQAVRYGYDARGPSGQNERFVPMGAYDAPYRVASEAYVLTANVAYRLDVRWWAFETITLYNDYSRIIKIQDGFRDSHQNTLGTLVQTGPLYVYIDAVLGKHHPWIGPSYGSALAEGAVNDDWEFRLNTNIGYYF
jgi:hypothetical protein